VAVNDSDCCTVLCLFLALSKFCPAASSPLECEDDGLFKCFVEAGSVVFTVPRCETASREKEAAAVDVALVVAVAAAAEFPVKSACGTEDAGSFAGISILPVSMILLH
jgi:hypothetical protein